MIWFSFIAAASCSEDKLVDELQNVRVWMIGNFDESMTLGAL